MDKFTSKIGIDERRIADLTSELKECRKRVREITSKFDKVLETVTGHEKQIAEITAFLNKLDKEAYESEPDDDFNSQDGQFIADDEDSNGSFDFSEDADGDMSDDDIEPKRKARKLTSNPGWKSGHSPIDVDENSYSDDVEEEEKFATILDEDEQQKFPAGVRKSPLTVPIVNQAAQRVPSSAELDDIFQAQVDAVKPSISCKSKRASMPRLMMPPPAFSKKK